MEYIDNWTWSYILVILNQNRKKIIFNGLVLKDV